MSETNNNSKEDKLVTAVNNLIKMNCMSSLPKWKQAVQLFQQHPFGSAIVPPFPQHPFGSAIAPPFPQHASFQTQQQYQQYQLYKQQKEYKEFEQYKKQQNMHGTIQQQPYGSVTVPLYQQTPYGSVKVPSSSQHHKALVDLTNDKKIKKQKIYSNNNGVFFLIFLNNSNINIYI